MNSLVVYTALTLTALFSIVILVYLNWVKGPVKSYSLLPGIAIGFVLAGLFTGGERLVSYGFMGIGVLIALLNLRQKRPGKPGTEEEADET
ncbi:MAG: hypothetical protein AAGU05_05250 [Anaerolineaceae bacterium]